MGKDVFVSYSRADGAFVERLNALLLTTHVTTWFDQTSLIPGVVWAQVINEQIDTSRIFLTCFSKSAMANDGFFHAEQEAALRRPPTELYVIPVTLGDCNVPPNMKQYHIVDLAEPGAVERVLQSMATRLGRPVVADPEFVNTLRTELLGHLGMEGLSNQDLAEQFLRTEEISFQDAITILERIANSADPTRITILSKLGAMAFLSYAEQAAIGKAIVNVKSGRRTENLQESVRAEEMARICRMAAPGGAAATRILQVNKYARYISRKNTEAYAKAEAYIFELLR